MNKRLQTLMPALIWGLCCPMFLLADIATNRFVVKDNINAAEPYDTWHNAAPDIQTAIDYAIVKNGDEVIVGPGTYDSGTTVAGGNNNRINLKSSITVRSRDNDPTTTVIKGAWDPASTNGPLAVRCVYMNGNSSLIGFTLTNGATMGLFLSNPDTFGGGAFVSLPATLSNCVITGCSAYYGGGVYGSATLYNCRVEGNFAYRGGGTYSATLHNSIIRNNVAMHMQDSNRRGGGMLSGSAYSCLIEGNRALVGGGARSAQLFNCTIVNNVGGSSSGTRDCTLWNCIAWNNVCYSDSVAYYSRGEGSPYLLNNCTQADPMFVDAETGNWNLRPGSPCINTGTNAPWMAGALDLAGNPRIDRIMNRVDMGCYEVTPGGSLFLIR